MYFTYTYNTVFFFYFFILDFFVVVVAAVDLRNKEILFMMMCHVSIFHIFNAKSKHSLETLWTSTHLGSFFWAEPLLWGSHWAKLKCVTWSWQGEVCDQIILIWICYTKLGNLSKWGKKPNACKKLIHL